MEWIIIVFGILCVVFFDWNILTDNTNGRLISAILLTISAIILVVVTASYESRNTPTALDVYQGNTTLEITYRDSIPVDSVVVFKEE